MTPARACAPRSSIRALALPSAAVAWGAGLLREEGPACPSAGPSVPLTPPSLPRGCCSADAGRPGPPHGLAALL